MVRLRPAINRLTDGRVFGVALLAILILIAVVAQLIDSNSAGMAELPAEQVDAPTGRPLEQAGAISDSSVTEVGSATWALELLHELVVSEELAPADEPHTRNDSARAIEVQKPSAFIDAGVATMSRAAASTLATYM